MCFGYELEDEGEIAIEILYAIHIHTYTLIESELLFYDTQRNRNGQKLRRNFRPILGFEYPEISSYQ